MANEKRLIDANALILAIRDDAEIVGKHYARIKMHINGAPTVDAVEVVHGRWEDAHEIKSFRHTNIPVVKCSKCECYFCDIINNHHYMYHYCPNCGAKMDGDGNG